MSYDIQYFSFSSIGIHSWRRRQQRRHACFPISWLKFLNKWHWAEICADLTIQKPSPTCIIQIGFDKRMRMSSNFNRKDMLNCNAKVFGSQWVEEKERERKRGVSVLWWHFHLHSRLRHEGLQDQQTEMRNFLSIKLATERENWTWTIDQELFLHTD